MICCPAVSISLSILISWRIYSYLWGITSYFLDKFTLMSSRVHKFAGKNYLITLKPIPKICVEMTLCVWKWQNNGKINYKWCWWQIWDILNYVVYLDRFSQNCFQNKIPPDYPPQNDQLMGPQKLKGPLLLGSLRFDYFAQLRKNWNWITINVTLVGSRSPHHWLPNLTCTACIRIASLPICFIASFQFASLLHNLSILIYCYIGVGLHHMCIFRPPHG